MPESVHYTQQELAPSQRAAFVAPLVEDLGTLQKLTEQQGVTFEP